MPLGQKSSRQHESNQICAALIFSHENFYKTLDRSKKRYLNKLFLD
jgi:hypothetical protein